MIEYVQLPLDRGLRSIISRLEPLCQLEVINCTLPHHLIEILEPDGDILHRINYTRVSDVDELLTEVSKYRDTQQKHVVVICELKLLVKASVGMDYRELNKKLVQVLQVSRTNQMFILESEDMPFIKMLCV